MRQRLALRATLAAGVLIFVCVPGSASGRDTTAIRREAFELSYNLDREQALTILRKAAADHPTDPAAHRALASVVWFTILFNRGAVTVDHYLGSFNRTQVELSKPPPALNAEFQKHVAMAIQLAEARVAASPNDVQARYDLGAAVALQASHIATVQGKMFAGFKAARRAYDEHERVLATDPARKDAALIVGTYRYVVSTLSLPLRMMAYVAGFGGGRERGIQMIQQTAAEGRESQTDAMFALVLLHNRERRFDDALRILGQLRSRYPRNRLVVLEAGSTALRAARAGEAERLLTEGIAMVEKDTRPLMPGEKALWHYKRGAARLALNNLTAARDDLNVAVGSDAQEWVRGRANAELSRLSMRTGDRATARTYAVTAESLCHQGSDPVCVNDARKLIRSSSGR